MYQYNFLKTNLFTAGQWKNRWLALPAIGCIMLLYSCGSKNSSAGANSAMAAGRKATVIATKVQPAEYTVTESFPATLMANNVVQLRTDVTGYLEHIHVNDGSHVHKGQVLYEIDKSRYQAAYNQAKATLQQAQAELAQRKRDLQRYQNLMSHDATSQQTLDQAATAEKTAEANMAAAQAAQDKASTDLDHAVLKAPISGKIGIAQVKIGDIVNAGQTLINTIVNDNPMYADYDIPQSRYRDFEGGQHSPSSTKKYYLQFADSSTYSYPGRLLFINNMVDQNTGSIRVRLQFPNKEGLLKSGMSSVVLVKYQTDSTQLAIPQKAIIETLAETSVYIADSDNVIQSKRIQQGAQTDNNLLIVNKGLQAGDRVVTEGLQKTRPGDTVNVKMTSE